MKDLNYIEVKQIGSTNEYLKKITVEENLPEGFVVYTNNQTQGKGQGANLWESEPGKNLTFSILFRPVFLDPSEMFLISKAISLGIIDYLNFLDKCFTIKWPNDIYYCNKKVGGILIENQLLGNKINYSLVGIGINVNQKKFVSDAPNPISLLKILNKELNLHDSLKEILGQINIWYEMLTDGHYEKINERYFAHLFRNKGYHDFIANKNKFQASIETVDNDGKLNLKSKDGTIKSFYFKEVEFLL